MLFIDAKKLLWHFGLFFHIVNWSRINERTDEESNLKAQLIMAMESSINEILSVFVANRFFCKSLMLLNKWQTTYNKSNKNIIRSSISAHSFVYPCWCKCVETFKIQSAWFNKGFLGYFNLVCAAKPYLVHSSVLCFEKLLFRFWRLCPCLYIRTLHGIMIRIINSNENQLRKWYSTLLTLLKGIKETSAA